MHPPSSFYRIMHIDDNMDDHVLLREAVAELPGRIVVVWARDAFAALDILTSDPCFDLIVSDLNMPRMDGVEFCRHAESLDRVATIPKVLVSNCQFENLPRRFEIPPTVPYFTKPIVWSEFMLLANELFALLCAFPKNEEAARRFVSSMRHAASPATEKTNRSPSAQPLTK